MRGSQEDQDGLAELAEATLDGLGHLMAEHVRLSKLELEAQLERLWRRAVLCLAVVFLIALGYALACLGLCLVLSPWTGLAGALLALGGAHITCGAIGLQLVLATMKPALGAETAGEVQRSLAELARALRAEAGHAPENT
ncbi:hypothetical protein HY251_00860 [bacterium]|nr:hypothetical protein [bacterium]